MKPRICEVLGVEVNEEFFIKGKHGKLRINDTGKRERFDGSWYETASEEALTEIINDPSLIIRQKQFSDDEKAMMRELARIGCQWMMRNRNNQIDVYADIHKLRFFTLPSKLFPQVKWTDEPFDMKAFLESEAHQ